MEFLQEQLKAKKAGISYAVLTVAETEGTSPWKIGKKMLLLEDGTTYGTIGGGELERQVLQEAAQAIKEKQNFFRRYTNTPSYEEPGLGCSFKASLLVEVVCSSLQLVVCGGGHVGSAVLRLGKLLNFETTLIDNRFPGHIEEKIDIADRFIQCNTFEEGISGADIYDGAYYLCCASTHTQDKSALKGALQKRFAYVGMLGSIKKTKEMYRQLEEEGISKDLLEQVHSPVGLDICDMSPEEVAFSVLAEILMLKNGGTGKPRRDLKAAPTTKVDL
ncbi:MULTISPECIES: XdhC/CoxI family protein [unclassified Dehalobacter]|jgi:Xanthine and CO dehydrogenases maturation factor, XdhC/CoxF family|uniref:XdhC family protein n=1 Tax=unclassified Dehalobacter TaxID=2635733 RepID=UPI00028A95A9|nr:MULTISPECIES: XdhC/CoxI family protein [unclassified Dehalobacter]AFV01147.1 Xanthine and CO dehydrogenases maturation factor, XdhC/CoxF family [Dehalobacter sp. DCA]AFV04190.1 putative xanthine dehydrogenase accessory factor subfamily, putative [Dehalobacter sp. CF]